jgi:hypothetical protein
MLAPSIGLSLSVCDDRGHGVRHDRDGFLSGDPTRFAERRGRQVPLTAPELAASMLQARGAPGAHRDSWNGGSDGCLSNPFFD